MRDSNRGLWFQSINKRIYEHLGKLWHRACIHLPALLKAVCYFSLQGSHAVAGKPRDATYYPPHPYST